MTLLNPKTTFLYVPVRVFLAIRLTTSLGFEIDEELRAAIDSDAKAAINLVFWRETIGHGVYLMMSYAKDNQHVEAIRMFVTCSYFGMSSMWIRVIVLLFCLQTLMYWKRFVLLT